MIGPIIGITLVLMAVFLPTAFLGGITGQLYRQFALTIAATAVISAINAVTLKPAQCAVYLRPTPRAEERLLSRRSTRSTTAARRSTPRSSAAPSGTSRAMMLAVRRRSSRLTGWWFTRLPTGFLPTEDQGYAIVGIQLPDAASQARTRAVVDKVNAILKKTPGRRELVPDRRPVDPRPGGRLERGGHVRHLHALVESGPGSPGLSQEEILGNFMGQVAADPRGDRSSPSRRRPSRAWAWPAASRCSSRTAAASGLDELQQVARRDGPRRQRPDRA